MQVAIDEALKSDVLTEQGLLEFGRGLQTVLFNMWLWVSYTISIIATPFKWCASFFAGNPPLAKPTADATTQAFGTVFLGPFGPKKITKDASTQTCDLLGEHHESIQIASDAISNIF